ncbi:MAG: hypothetical protein C4531_01790 [Desulfurivibrio sp.]|nr:MAG: hypothetical protein C4531_01790 [Desulfurivibrio sp.]
MIDKNLFAGRLVVGAAMLLLLGGCQTAGGLLGPKKKVPPYVEMEKEAPAEVEKAAAPVPPVPAALEAEKAGEPAPGLPAAGRLDPAVLAGMADYVSTRLSHYRDRQEQWQGLTASFSQHDLALPQPEKWRECTDALNTIVDGYLALQSTLSSGGLGGTGSPYAAFQQDIVYLESDCQQVFTAAAAVIPEQLQTYRQTVAGQAEGVVRYWAAQGDHAKVVESYENLLGSGAEAGIAPETREAYARSLRATGRLEQAADVLLGAARGKDALQAWPLRLQAADLLFAEGKFSRARQEYEGVAGLFASLKQGEVQAESQLALLAGETEHGSELELYRRVLKGWLQYDGTQASPDMVESVQRLEELFPGTVHARMARELLDKTGGAPLQQNADAAMAQARQLAAERKFAEALAVLAPWSGEAQPGETVSPVKALEEEIRAQQAQEAQLQILQEKEALDAKWQKAMEVLDHQQFDQSIVLFEELLDTSYQDQARLKIAEAVNLAAAELRKEAANLFIKARKSTDIEQKKSLLLESRRLLLLVQQKYPQADIIDKVKQNQKATEDQLRALDPNLLAE